MSREYKEGPAKTFFLEATEELDDSCSLSVSLSSSKGFASLVVLRNSAGIWLPVISTTSLSSESSSPEEMYIGSELNPAGWLR